MTKVAALIALWKSGVRGLLFGALLAFPTFANSQQPAFDTSKLREKGFTVAELNSFNIVQVAPHFTLYTNWKRCVANIASLMIQSGKTPQETASFSFSSCDDAEGSLRASIARQIGLAKAIRMIAIARASTQIEFQNSFAKAHPPRPGLFGEIGMWEITSPSPRLCHASVKNIRDDDGEFVILEQNQASSSALFAIMDKPSEETLSAISNGYINRTVWTAYNNAGKKVGAFRFKFKSLPGGYGFILDLTPALISTLRAADHFQIEGTNFMYNVNGFGPAWDMVQRCVER